MNTAHRAHFEPTEFAPSTMGKLFVSILFIAVFEGGIRKWISIDYTIPLVLLRDCLAVYGVFWAAQSGEMNLDQKGLQVLWLWSALVVCWGLAQLMVIQPSPVVFIVGIRFWLLYLWFAYAAAVSLTEDDFRYIMKTILWLLVIMTPLAVTQFFLPPSDFLNKQLDDDQTDVFVVTKNIVRTTGTFSFALGYSTLLAIVNPFVFALLTSDGRFGGNKWVHNVLILALAVATMVSGSRSALLLFGLMIVVYIFTALRYSKEAKKDSTMPRLLATLLILAAVPSVFFNAADTMQERFELAAENENFFERVTHMLIGESAAYEKLTLIGYGIGAGNNFAAVEATGERTFLLEETEAARTILEGGLIGFAFIGLKLMVILIGLRQSVRIVKSTGHALPLFLWITLAIGLLTWSIIGQLTVNVLGYLLLGLGIASLRLELIALEADEAVCIEPDVTKYA